MDMCSLLEADTGMSNSQLNETNFWQFSQFIPDTLFTIVTSMLPNVEYHPWVFSMIGSTLIGLSGVFPLLVIPIEEGANLKNGEVSCELSVSTKEAMGLLYIMLCVSPQLLTCFVWFTRLLSLSGDIAILQAGGGAVMWWEVSLVPPRDAGALKVDSCASTGLLRAILRCAFVCLFLFLLVVSSTEIQHT
uniref:Uncharacterized protein n=1 Tax=Timema monikensis TaxID=170555 RepID=A0A7R9E745_9NEOP|nr:unnamed protein product [Timema monikensis]